MPGETRATAVAATELVIALSIAQRTGLVYGGGHDIARRGAERVTGALARALHLESPLHFRFSPRNVFLGARNLSPGHTILRNVADRFWRRGVAGLSIKADATADGLMGLLRALNEATRRRATREESERMLKEARPSGVEIHFLREILTHEVRDEVTVLTPEEAERQWDELMSHLESIGGPLRLRHGVEVTAEGTPGPNDFASLVWERLRHLQEDEELAIREADVGHKLNQLVRSLDSRLRRQIVTAAMRAPDLTPDSLERFVSLVGHDTLLDTLTRINESGHRVSPSAMRALSMLSLTQRTTDTPGSTVGGKAAAGADLFGDELQDLLERMMRDDEGDDYSSEELMHLLRNAEAQAQRIAAGVKVERSGLPLNAEEGERHFLLAARELLHDAPADGELAEAVCRESQTAYLRLLDRGAARGLDEAMELARKAGASARRDPAEPWAWEQEPVLERLRLRLTESGRWEAEASVDQLVAIGGAAVPSLLEVLATSDSLAVRRRALAGLETMADSPAPQLLPLLGPEQPWFLQRNAIYLLRRRKDPAGAAAAAELWPVAAPRLKLEILEYLVTVGHPAGARILEKVLATDNHDEVLTAARAALKTPSRDVIVAVIRRAEALAKDLIGGDFHLSLLRALAATRHPQALHYVAELPARKLPVLPWQRQRYRQEVAAMVEGRRPS